MIGSDDGTFGRKPETHGLFRKIMHLDSVPTRVPARITADSRYILIVNGHEVFRGPVRSQPRRQSYDLFDLAPYLVTGTNVIAVHVKYFGTTKAYWMPAIPNATLGKTGVLVFEANVGGDIAAANWLVSDGSWKARKSAAWNASEPGVMSITSGVPDEVFDARDYPPAWETHGFDDSAWGQAQVITAVHIGHYGHSQPPTDPYGRLLPRHIAKLDGDTHLPQTLQVEVIPHPLDISSTNPAQRVETSVLSQHSAAADSATLPIAIQQPANAGYTRIRIDMGRIVAGLVQFGLRAPAGTILDFSYVEDPIQRANFFGAHGGNRYIASGAPNGERHEVFDPKGFRYAYVLVHGTTDTVSLTSFAVRELLYPWQAGPTFACSDADLNKLYTAGIRTVQLNSWDAFIDCPTREQRAWTGDAVVHQMVHLATNADWRLAWHYLALCNSPRSDGILPMSVAGDVEYNQGFTIGDWSLHWVHGVYNLYRYTGDKNLVKEYLPTIERVLRWYLPYQTAAGVLSNVVEWNLVDWSSLYSNEDSAMLTAHWARSLHEFAEMAGWLGESASQRWAQGLHDKAKIGFEVFWDEARGVYVDYAKDGVQQRPVNQIASALAIVSGLAPQLRHRRIIEAITDPDKLVISSWMPNFSPAPLTPEQAGARMGNIARGIRVPDWDVENKIVIAEPFMSYVVHDAVAQVGMADKLPDLYKRWLGFLKDGFDTFGEAWGAGTHVHGWSATPSRDMAFYTLGVTPAEPGFAVARIAPRLGPLDWAEGTVPTPHGLIRVRAERDRLTVDSPVPVIIDLPNQTVRTEIRYNSARVS